MSGVAGDPLRRRESLMRRAEPDRDYRMALLPTGMQVGQPVAAMAVRRIDGDDRAFQNLAVLVVLAVQRTGTGTVLGPDQLMTRTVPRTGRDRLRRGPLDVARTVLTRTLRERDQLPTSALPLVEVVAVVALAVPTDHAETSPFC